MAHEYFSVLYILQVGQQIQLCKEKGIEEAVQTLTHHRQPLTLWKDASRLLLDLDKRLEFDMDKKETAVTEFYGSLSVFSN